MAIKETGAKQRRKSILVLLGLALAALICMALVAAPVFDSISKALSGSNLPPQVRTMLKTKEEAKLDETLTSVYGLVKERKFAQAEQQLEALSNPATLLGKKAASALAWIYGADGKYDQAEDLCKKIGGGTPGGTAATLHTTAYEIDRRGHWMKATELYRRAIAYSIQAYGADDARTARNIYALAVCDQRAGRIDEAIEGYRKALPAFEKAGSTQSDWVEKTKRHLQIAEEVKKELSELK